MVIIVCWLKACMLVQFYLLNLVCIWYIAFYFFSVCHHGRLDPNTLLGKDSTLTVLRMEFWTIFIFDLCIARARAIQRSKKKLLFFCCCCSCGGIMIKTRPNEFGSMTARKDDSITIKSIFCQKLTQKATKYHKKRT